MGPIFSISVDNRAWMHVQALVYFVGKSVIANDNEKLRKFFSCSRIKVDTVNILQF